eukprot:jgi/Chlat1/7277/Chrsp58S06877
MKGGQPDCSGLVEDASCPLTSNTAFELHADPKDSRIARILFHTLHSAQVSLRQTASTTSTLSLLSSTTTVTTTITTTPLSLTSLPLDPMRLCLGSLSASDLLNCMLACKEWYVLGADDAVWEALFWRRIMAEARAARALGYYDDDTNVGTSASRSGLSIVPMGQNCETVPSLVKYALFFRPLCEEDMLVSSSCGGVVLAPIAAVKKFALLLSAEQLPVRAAACLYARYTCTAPLRLPCMRQLLRVYRWLQVEFPRHKSHSACMRSIVRHFADEAYAALLDTKRDPYFSLPASLLRDERDRFWLFDFADGSEACPEYIKDWLRTAAARTRGPLEAGRTEQSLRQRRRSRPLIVNAVAANNAAVPVHV